MLLLEVDAETCKPFNNCTFLINIASIQYNIAGMTHVSQILLAISALSRPPPPHKYLATNTSSIVSSLMGQLILCVAFELI